MTIRDRIVELRRVRAGDLLAHPKNWRIHPRNQVAAMREILGEVGYADAVLARETDAGLELIDGHMRADLDPEQELPVLVLDVDEHEAERILATHDPIAEMAETNQAAFLELAGTIPEEEDSHDKVNPIEAMEHNSPPTMSWVLIGIPTVRYGEIAEMVDELTTSEGVHVQVSYNDKDTPGERRRPRKTISKKRRFAILQRDGFRCQICGADASQASMLHVDHKISLSKGGTDSDDNLWTLCHDCNTGKSDKELTGADR